MKWYYSKDGQQIGPVDFSEIERLHENGALASDALVWQQGTPNWVKLSTVLWAAPTTPGATTTVGSPDPVLSTGSISPAAPAALAPAKTNTFAIVSLVLGILSPFCCGCLTGIPAIIFGHLALNKLKADSGETGKGLAMAGLILGYLAIVITIVYVIFMVATGGFETMMEAAKAAQHSGS